MAPRSRSRVWPVVFVVLGGALLVVGMLGRSRPAEDLPSTTDTEVLGRTVEAARAPTAVYMSPDGSDGNDGHDRDQPVRSLDRALERRGDGLPIILLAGTHDALVIDGVDGSLSQPVLIRGEAGATVATGVYSGDGPGGSGAAVLIEDSSHVIVEDLEARTSLWGVRVIASEDITVRRMTVHDIGQEAIHIAEASTRVLVENNVVFDTGNRPGALADGRSYAFRGEGIYVGTGSSGVFDRTTHVTVRGNEIYGTSAEAIDIKHHTDHIVVEDNVVRDLETTMPAVALGHSTEETAPESIVVRNNVIRNISRSNEAENAHAIGIVVSMPATIYNNVIWRADDYGIQIDRTFTGPVDEVRLYHNTVHALASRGDIVLAAGMGSSPADVDAVNNIGLNLEGNIDSYDSLFVDADGGDLRLVADAPAVDAGVFLDLVPVDVSGIDRGEAADFGAHERPATAAPTTTTSAPRPSTTEHDQASGTSTSAPAEDVLSGTTTNEAPTSAPTSTATVVESESEPDGVTGDSVDAPNEQASDVNPPVELGLVTSVAADSSVAEMLQPSALPSSTTAPVPSARDDAPEALAFAEVDKASTGPPWQTLAVVVGALVVLATLAASLRATWAGRG